LMRRIPPGWRKAALREPLGSPLFPSAKMI
jgi:hypothetical protein